MKRALIFASTFFLLAGLAWLQVVPPPARRPAAMMPSGALLSIEAKDFSALLAEWNQSATKANWVKSANYSAFAESNLFQKMSGVFKEYTTAAEFVPGLGDVLQIAGTESALALYDPRELEFLYITRLPESRLTASQLWALRGQFETRQAAGKTFYLHRDAKRTVAFALSGDYFLLATRDDLVARALELQSGSTDPSLAAESWYKDAVAASPEAGDARMVLNLKALVTNTYFRSYWVMRNVAELKPFRSEICDLDRTSPDRFTERRILLRDPDAITSEIPQANRAAMAALTAFNPADTGLYRAWASPAGDTSDTAAQLIIHKLLDPEPGPRTDDRYAPPAAMAGIAGTEADLETRLDEPPLPSVLREDGSRILRPWLAGSQIEAVAEIQSSFQPPASDFISLPAVILIESAREWNLSRAQSVLSAALSSVVSESDPDAGWTAADGQVFSTGGLQQIHLAIRGRVLFLSNDAALLASTLSAHATLPATQDAGYLAIFRHSRERGPYERLVLDLDAQNPAAMPFFSSNVLSLSTVLANIQSVTVIERPGVDRVTQKIEYQEAR